MHDRFPVLIARVRMPLLCAAAIDLITWPWHGVDPLGLAGLAVMGVMMVSMYLPIGQVRRDPVVVRLPVLGRWVAVNSPADRVPSHGVHAYGQSYAIDLVHHPDEAADWKPVRAWPPARPPRLFRRVRPAGLRGRGRGGGQGGRPAARPLEPELLARHDLLFR